MTSLELAPLFGVVADVLRQNREAFNQADPDNHNHGDHLLEVFQVASQAAGERSGAGLGEAMAYAAERLRRAGQGGQNGSAGVYALGLEQFARQFTEHQISLEELVAYVQGLVQEQKEARSSLSAARGGELLKALVAGLAGWQSAMQASESGEALPASRGMDMGYLFDLGIIYMQAKQRGGSRVETLAEAAATASPLSHMPYRLESGRLALQTLLQAMADLPAI